MPVSGDPDEWTEVYRGPTDSACYDHALVLAAVDIDYDMAVDGDDHVLRVPVAAALRAGQELAWYEAENRDWPPPEVVPERVVGGLHGALGYDALLLAVFASQQRGGLPLDWWDAGVGRSAAIRQGEWWRAVTALTLHADAVHLAGNLLFGSLFIALLCRRLGTGPAWFGALAAGAMGNLGNAFLHPPTHTFVGASTAVFAAIGILVVGQRQGPAPSGPPLVGRWTPLLAGAAFLAFLGTSGEHTDVVAHLAGLACGMASGLWWRRVTSEASLSWPWQVALAWAALLIVVLSWFCAFVWG